VPLEIAPQWWDEWTENELSFWKQLRSNLSYPAHRAEAKLAFLKGQ